MLGRRLPKFRKGDPFPSAQQLNDLVEAIRRAQPLKGRGIALQDTPDGTVISATSPGQTGRLAQTSGVITARSSSTAGTGTVKLCTLDPSTRIITVGSVTQTVYNFAASPNTGIPDGKYCWIAQDEAGNWWVISVEC